jgi:tetratricopeptide (TPR) repeat protein
MPVEASIRDLLESASLACRAKRCEEAIAALERVAQLDSDSSATHYFLGCCYAGGCRQHSLTDPDLAQHHLRKALSLLPPDAPRESAKILSTLGNTYMTSSRLPPRARILAAFECHGKAAALFEAQGQMEDWAREEYNLGNVCCGLPQDSFPERWERAIEHYTNALRVRTAATHPEGHARTLENMGTAYRELPTGDRRANLLRSIRCYREALRVYTPSAFPRESGAIHNNLGNTLLSLAAADRARGERHAQGALRHFARALRFRSRDSFPGDYATAQFNRGQALLWLAAEGLQPELHLGQALACFREAQQYFRASGQARLAGRAEERLASIASCLKAEAR